MKKILMLLVLAGASVAMSMSQDFYDLLGREDWEWVDWRPFDANVLELQLTVGEIAMVFIDNWRDDIDKVTGLPPGIEFDNSDGCDLNGLCTDGIDSLMGIPSKTGSYKVTFSTAKYRGGPIIKSVTRTIQVVRPSVTVAFDANGGMCVENERRIPLGEQLGALPHCARMGYEFVGWFTNPDGGNEVRGDAVLAGDLVLYAHWREFKGAYELGVLYGPSSAEVAWGDMESMRDYADTVHQPMVFIAGGPSCSYCRMVHESFKGSGKWDVPCLMFYDYSDGAYWGGKLPKEFGIKGIPAVCCYWNIGNGNIIKYAETLYPNEVGYVAYNRTDNWPINKDLISAKIMDVFTSLFNRARVYFDAEGGDSNVERFVDLGMPIGTLPVPTREKYAFGGWYTQEIGGTKISSYTKVTESVVYHAHWTYTGKSLVSAAFVDGCEGMGVVSGGQSVGGGTQVTLRATAKPGFIFAGWYQDAEGREPVEGETDYRSPSYVYVAGEDDVTFYARFIAVKDDWIDVETSVCSEFVPGVPIDRGALEVHVMSESLPTVRVTGLPPGLRFDAKTLEISGTPTMSGVYTVTVLATTASGLAREERFRVVVRGANEYAVSAKCVYRCPLTACCCEYTPSLVSVSGSGVYAPGEKVMLKAPPAPEGQVFAGWYGTGNRRYVEDEYWWGDPPEEFFDECLPVGGDVDYRNHSLPITVGYGDVEYYALYMYAEFDMGLSAHLDARYVWDVFDVLPIDVDSYSLPIVTVSGLPPGLAFDTKALVISGKPTKPGKYRVTVSLKNSTVKTAKTLPFEIVVPNIRSTLIAGGIDYASDAYNYVAGTAVEPILPKLVPGCTLTASGLPTGLSLVKVADGYAISGAPTAKAGSYTVTLNVTQGRIKDVATITVNVADLPAWAVGNFAGTVTCADGTHGTASFAVSAAGAISSGKLLEHGSNWTFTAKSFAADSVARGLEQDYVILADAKCGKVTRAIELHVMGCAAEGVAESAALAAGFFGDDEVELWRNVWKDTGAKGVLSGIAGKYTYFFEDGTALPLNLTSAGALSGKANIRARDNASVSFSTTVFASSDGVEAAFYVAADAKKGYGEIYERFTLVPESGEQEPGVAHRAPGVVAVPERYPDDEGYGTVSVSPAGGQVDAGKTVTVSASPDSKSVFVKWRYEVGGEIKYSEMSKLTLTMDGEHDVFASAVFRSKGSFKEPIVAVETSEQAKFAALELGVQFSAFVTVTDVENMKPVKWSASNLPSGLKINAETGEISGVATAVNSKPVVITATSVADSKKKTTFTLDIGAQDRKPAALPETAVGTFTGFVNNGTDNLGTFTFTSSEKGALSAKVVDAKGTVSFSGSGFASSKDGRYGVSLKTTKGEELTLTLNSAAGWDAQQLTGGYVAANGRALAVSAQRNAFSKAWYFAAVGDETAGWTFTFEKDAKAAALTVTLKADGTTSVAGKLPNGVDKNGKAVTLSVSASGVANAGPMQEGAVAADFAPVLTVSGTKKVLAIRTNLWFDRKNDHGSGVGEAKFVK